MGNRGGGRRGRSEAGRGRGAGGSRQDTGRVGAAILPVLTERGSGRCGAALPRLRFLLHGPPRAAPPRATDRQRAPTDTQTDRPAPRDRGKNTPHLASSHHPAPAPTEQPSPVDIAPRQRSQGTGHQYQALDNGHLALGAWQWTGTLFRGHWDQNRTGHLALDRGRGQREVGTGQRHWAPGKATSTEAPNHQQPLVSGIGHQQWIPAPAWAQ